MIIAIDPGPTDSAICRFTPPDQILGSAKLPNAEILQALRDRHPHDALLVIEELVSYGMVVGRSVFQTCFWSGRFAQQWKITTGMEAHLLPRMQVKRHLCGTVRASDRDIREELIHRFGPPGKKSARGKTYGIAADMWSALALAVTFAALQEEQRAAAKGPQESSAWTI